MGCEALGFEGFAFSCLGGWGFRVSVFSLRGPRCKEGCLSFGCGASWFRFSGFSTSLLQDLRREISCGLLVLEFRAWAVLRMLHSL